MKTYEEMARDVLKRRDEELRKLHDINASQNNAPTDIVYPENSKKRRLLPKIVIPCTAAVTAAAVGIGIWSGIPHRDGYILGAAAESESTTEPEYELVPGTSDEIQDIALLTKIDILEERPEYIKKHALFNGGCIPGPCEFVPYTIEELNRFYGIEFNRLGRLHSDWNESNSRRFGIYVRPDEGTESGSSAAYGEEEIVTSLNTIHYELEDAQIAYDPDRKWLSVDATLVGSPENMFSPFDSSLYSGPDIFSVINGKKALIYHDDFSTDETALEAMIEMGKTLVIISSHNISEEEFFAILEEYTAEFDNENDTKNPNPNDERNDIKIHDKAPGFFQEANPFNVPDTPDLADCDFRPYTFDRLNDYYGIEFDRLTRLYADWKEWHGDLGIYTRSINNGDAIIREIVYACNSIDYQLPNGAFVNITVKPGEELPVEIFNGMDTADYETTYSTINGCTAMLSRSGFAGEFYDTVEYPNGDQRFGAVIKMGNALVHFKTAGLTEEEFINILKEYTVV